MKKRFTLILASMFLAMGAWAQLADGVYTIKNVIDNRGTLVAVDGQTNVGAADITLSGYAGKSEDAMTDGDKWYVCTVEDNVFLYNVANGKFLNSRQDNPVQFSADPVLGFTLTAKDDNTYYVIANGGYKVSCCPGWDKGQTVRWLSEDESASQHLTFALVENGTTTFATQITAADAAIEALLNASFSFNYISGENATNTWSEALNVYPAGLSNEVACGGGKGNSAQHIGADGHSVHKAVSAINAKGGDLTVTIQYDADLGNHAHAISTLGVDVVNANGEVVASDYHLGFSGGSSFSNTYTLSGLAAGNYILRYYVCNKSGDHELTNTSGTITVNGALEITEAADVATMLTSLKANTNTKVVPFKGNGLGYYDETAVDAIEDQMSTAVEETVAANTAAFVALDDAVDALVLVPSAAFYRLKGKASGNYMNAVTDRTNIGMVSKENRDAAGSIFYLTENDKLLSYNIGTYLYLTHSIGALGEDNGNAVYFYPSESGNAGYLTLKTNLSSLVGGQYIYDNTSKVDRNSSYKESNCEWVVEAVEELPVTIGTVGYATLHAPVALTVPADVTAYTGALNDANSVLTLTAIYAGATIPANTAVILEATETLEEATIFNFAVADDVPAIEDNDLVGTMDKSSFTSNVYTLQSHNGGVAFKQYIGEYLTGFKAYLTVESQNQAIRIRKAGDEETTSIEPSTLNPQPSTVIYDLQGRRVQQMEKGIYIVNGRKVIR